MPLGVLKSSWDICQLRKQASAFSRSYKQARWAIAAVTIFAAAQKIIGFPIAAIAVAPFEAYRKFVESVTAPFQPCVEEAIQLVGSMIRLELHLSENWKFLAVPLLLYFSRDFVELLARGRWATAIGGGVVALFIVVLSGADASDKLSIQLGMPMAALSFYAFTQTYLTSLVHPPAGQSFAETFVYYLKNTFLPATAVSVASFGLGWFVAESFPRVSSEFTIASTMLTYVLLMSIYWIAQARDVARREGQPVESLGAYKLGMGVFGAMSYFAVLLLSNYVASLAGVSP